MRVPRPPPLAGRPPKREPRPCLSERFHLGNTPARQSALRFSWAVTNAARFGTERALEPLRRVNAAGTHLLSLSLPGRWEGSALGVSLLEISQEGRNRQSPPKVLSRQRQAHLRDIPGPAECEM